MFILVHISLSWFIGICLESIWVLCIAFYIYIIFSLCLSVPVRLSSYWVHISPSYFIGTRLESFWVLLQSFCIFVFLSCCFLSSCLFVLVRLNSPLVHFNLLICDCSVIPWSLFLKFIFRLLHGWMGWMDGIGMVINGHRSFKITFGASNSLAIRTHLLFVCMHDIC